jgi:hypothetical protein
MPISFLSGAFFFGIEFEFTSSVNWMITLWSCMVCREHLRWRMIRNSEAAATVRQTSELRYDSYHSAILLRRTEVAHLLSLVRTTLRDCCVKYERRFDGSISTCLYPHMQMYFNLCSHTPAAWHTLQHNLHIIVAKVLTAARYQLPPQLASHFQSLTAAPMATYCN